MTQVVPLIIMKILQLKIAMLAQIIAHLVILLLVTVQIVFLDLPFIILNVWMNQLVLKDISSKL